MLNEKNKSDIYSKLILNFKTGEKYSLSDVGKYLTTNGFNAKRFGYGQMRSLLKDIPEFMEVSNEGDGRSNGTVIIREWNGPEKKNAPDNGRSKDMNKTERSSLDKIEDENETASLSVFQKSNFESFTSTNRSYSNFSRNYGNYHQDNTASESRASARGVRFTGATGSSTFKSEPVLKEKVNKEIDKAENPKQEEESSFERLAYLPPKVLDYLSRKGMSDPARVLNEAYLSSLKNKTYLQRGSTITFPFIASDGSEMLAVLRRNEKAYGKPWYLSYVGYPQKEENEPEETEDREEEKISVPGKMLENFADIGYWQEFLKELAEMALPENWDYRSTRERGRYYILKKYIQYTFYRLQQQDKIAIAPGNFAAFNTGLVNNHYQDIYACFVPNPQADLQDENGVVPQWKFESFAIAGQRGKDGYGKMLTSYFNPLPGVATYYDSLSDLIYDLNAPLMTDYEHIIIDNIDRLPMDYLKECMYSDDYAQELLEHVENANSRERKKQAYYALSNYVVDNDRIFRRLKDRMEDAIEIAVKRVRWNFRSAVPCYYPKGNCMSLMLPLSLADDTKTDAALVVLKNPSGSYQGHTILELEKAYLDARLICRPNDDWMSSEVVAGSGQIKRIPEVNSQTRPNQSF